MARPKKQNKLRGIHGAVTPQHAEVILQIAETERRPMAQVVRILLEEAIIARQGRANAA